MSNIDDTAPISVRNLVNHKVVYTNAENNRRVVFEPFQVKNVPAGELRALNFSNGGTTLLHNFLSVQSSELRKEFNIPADMVEYDWKEQDIINVLTDLSQPIEALEDALEFGPDGIKEMIVDYAVAMKIPDSNRRRVISRMMGVNIDNMIEIQEKVAELQQNNDFQEMEAENHGRRMNKNDTTRTSGRRLKR